MAPADTAVAMLYHFESRLNKQFAVTRLQKTPDVPTLAWVQVYTPPLMLGLLSTTTHLNINHMNSLK